LNGYQALLQHRTPPRVHRQEDRRTRTGIFPRDATAVTACTIVNGLNVASVSAANESCVSGSRRNERAHVHVRRDADAGRVGERFGWSRVLILERRTARSAFSAASDGALAAIAPVSLTVTFFDAKNAFVSCSPPPDP